MSGTAPKTFVHSPARCRYLEPALGTACVVAACPMPKNFHRPARPDISLSLTLMQSDGGRCCSKPSLILLPQRLLIPYPSKLVFSLLAETCCYQSSGLCSEYHNVQRILPEMRILYLRSCGVKQFDIVLTIFIHTRIALRRRSQALS